MLLLSVGWYSVACMQAKSICISMYDGIKGARLCSSNTGYVYNVKCMVSASYTIFMLNTINALILLWLLAR